MPCCCAVPIVSCIVLQRSASKGYAEVKKERTGGSAYLTSVNRQTLHQQSTQLAQHQLWHMPHLGMLTPHRGESAVLQIQLIAVLLPPISLQSQSDASCNSLERPFFMTAFSCKHSRTLSTELLLQQLACHNRYGCAHLLSSWSCPMSQVS